MLIAAEKGAELIVSVGSQFNLVEFLDKNRRGMSSTFLTRLRVGEILVDAKGVGRLYRPRPGAAPLALRRARRARCALLAIVAADAGAARRRRPAVAQAPGPARARVSQRADRMFDFRYHALSLVAVFLALVVGLLLGVAIGDKGLVSVGAQDMRDSLRDDVRQRRTTSATTPRDGSRAARALRGRRLPAPRRRPPARPRGSALVAARARRHRARQVRERARAARAPTLVARSPCCASRSTSGARRARARARATRARRATRDLLDAVRRGALGIQMVARRPARRRAAARAAAADAAASSAASTA